MSTLVGVVGTDGIVPIYNPNDRWTIWSIDEIYRGQSGKNKYVPKVNDYVIDPVTFTVYQVAAIDPVTFVPVLVQKTPTNYQESFTNLDRLVGINGSTSPFIYRAYIDKRTNPYTLSVDSQLHVNGSMVRYAKIFRGVDLSDTGNVISRVYTPNGQYIGNTITLEKVAFNSHDNYAIYGVPTCHTLEDLPDGEIVTIVFYSATGIVVSRRELIVENTSFIRKAFNEERYITDISLKNVFMQSDGVIYLPLNVIPSKVNYIGVVHYSDGSTLELPVDGSKFSLYGLEEYLSTVIGQSVDLVLSYRLSDGEATYAANNNGVNRYITKSYRMQTVDVDYSYSVKLFGYPEYVDRYQGYRMRWFLLDLERTSFVDVTSMVRWNDSTGAFDPLGYGIVQRKAVSITLSDINASYKPYIHSQLVDIVLKGAPNSVETAWLVGTEVGANRQLYGDGINARIDINFNTRCRIDSGFNTLDEWLSHVYALTYPLYDPRRESTPPRPTHFEVMAEGKIARYPIEQWNYMLDLGAPLTPYSTIYIRFLKQGPLGYLYLSVAGMTLKPAQ